MYKTPNGLEYGVGSKFTVHHLDTYIIDSIEDTTIHITMVSRDSSVKNMEWGRESAERLFDENTSWKLLSEKPIIEVGDIIDGNSLRNMIVVNIEKEHYKVV